MTSYLLKDQDQYEIDFYQKDQGQFEIDFYQKDQDQDQDQYAIEFYQKYQDELKVFTNLSSENYSSLLSTIFSNDICNDMIMHVHVECEKIKNLLLEEYCKIKYNISELIMAGSGGEQWMVYGDSDIDVMYVENELVTEYETTNSLYFIYTQYPSYVLLRRGQQTISHVDVLKLKKYSDTFEQYKLYEHGPAYCIKTPISPNDDQSVVEQMETDVVPCYKLIQWPTAATEYFHRKSRQYAWPPIEVIHRCLNNEIPCLLTPVGYKLSDQRDYEWRISFSLIEMDLLSIKSCFSAPNIFQTTLNALEFLTTQTYQNLSTIFRNLVRNSINSSFNFLPLVFTIFRISQENYYQISADL
ncbi:unnamed protein product [Rotaria sp. Silwood2]|nr:unnamed protein product [Rotaria sp. Silwood2]